MEEKYYHDSCAELWLDATTCLVCPARSVSQQAKRLHMARMIRSMLMNLSDVEVSSIMRKILLKTFKDDAKDSEPTFDMSADQVILWYQSAKLLTDEDAKQLNTFVWRGLKAAKAEALPA
jgi:hypothetical protein